MPTISVVIPTHRVDRPLRRYLTSIAPQLEPGDEVIVVGDTRDWVMPEVEATVTSFGSQFRYMEHDAGHHCWGHCQLNVAMATARGDYICANDDDDLHTSTALASIRKAATENPGRPLLFRFISYVGGQVFWHTKGLVERNHIGGHCLVLPNIPGKIGQFTCQYAGDFDWIKSTLDLHGGNDSAVWCEDIIAIARPVSA